MAECRKDVCCTPPLYFVGQGGATAAVPPSLPFSPHDEIIHFFLMLHMLEDIHWYRAASLVERRKAGLPSADATWLAENAEAHHRWLTWKSQPPFDDASFFAQRLALDALSEEQLHWFIAEPAAALQARFPNTPAWLDDLRQALSQANGTRWEQWRSKRWQRKPSFGFLQAAMPFIERGLARFAVGVNALSAQATDLPFNPETIQPLCQALLPKALLEILSRTLVVELHAARQNGELAGDSPAARFQSFTEQLRQPARLRALLTAYPVLARLLSQQTRHWADASLEFLTRLCRDWQSIKETFFDGTDPGTLIALKGGLADTRRGGRTVFIAKFSSGQRIVYKPKSLAADAHFQTLLHWVNERGAQPGFPLLKVMDCGTHGWVEHINARACESLAEVRRFYQRQGGYLALLYLIDATDFHGANLIACGEQPYLIDLEALFQPRRTSAPLTDLTPANEQAIDVVVHSVLNSGLLPKRSGGNSEFSGIDRSGLGMWEGQTTPYVVARWEAEGTDEMHLVRRHVPVLTQRNRPQLPGVQLDLRDFETELQAGFAATYELLRAHRDELGADDGPLARFASAEVCVFLRSMRTYRRLLSESYHPDVLRDALDRDRLFDALWVEVPNDADLARVIQYEQSALRRGDMPLFLTQPQSTDLLLDGEECLPDFFAEPSMTTVRRRLGQLNDKDRTRQAWFIQASLATLPIESEPASLSRVADSPSVTRDHLLEVAQAVGDRLEQLSIRGADDAAWLGLLQVQEQDWTIDALGFDLDTGLPGIALFLAYLGALTDEPRYTTLAQAALKTMQLQIAEWGDDVAMIGAFDGWGGMIYSLTHLGALWQRPDLLAEAEALVERLPELIEEDDELHVYGGAAGCLIALRSLAQFTSAPCVKEAAILCGDHLLAHADEISTPDFLRGRAGVAWALSALHQWTGLERFRPAAMVAPSQTAEWDNLIVSNHSLGNGAAGKLEALLQTRRSTAQETASLLASIKQHGWLCATPRAVETPGLLNGLAGIGWQLLRLAEPARVPSILFLAPPSARPAGL